MMKKEDVLIVAEKIGRLCGEELQAATPRTQKEFEVFVVETVIAALSPFLTNTNPVVAKGITPGAVGIKYIGDRQTHSDNLYGTNLTWVPGQVHGVNFAAAKKMLLHGDVYRVSGLTDEVIAPPESSEKPVETEPARLSIPLPNLEGMGKKEMMDFAQQHYGEKLHHAMSEPNMRAKVVALINERGR